MSGTITLIGASNSQKANVADNALLVRPYDEFEYAKANGKAYSWSSLTYDPDANDTILGVQNTSSTENLHICQITITSDAITQWVVHTSSGVTMAGTAVTGVNLNRSSTNLASAIAKTDETGNTQQADGYTGRIYTGRVPANGHVLLEPNGSIILPNNWMIGVDFTAAATAGNITIIGYYK